MYRAGKKKVKVKYSDIPEGGVRIPVRGEDAPWDGLRDLSVETAPCGHLFVRKSGPDVVVEGRVRATLWFECSRCLDRFRHSAEVSLEQVLRPRGEERSGAREIELHSEDLEFGIFDDENIPLASVVEEYLLLSLPMQPLCREDCKGLCPQCGANRNREDCDCRASRRASPFDSLKEFVIDKR